MTNSTNKIDSKDLCDFFCTNGSITRPGSYTLPKKDCIKALDHFIATGENHLSLLDDITHATWDKFDEWDSSQFYSDGQMVIIKEFLLGNLFWKDSDFDDFQNDILRRNYEVSKNIRIKNNTYLYRRKESLRNNQKLRKKLLEKFNNRCKKCQSNSNLEIDHIVSVRKGGSDKIDNLQVLCKSCNLSKGSK